MRLDKKFRNLSLESKRLFTLRLMDAEQAARRKLRVHRAARRGNVAALLATVDNPKHRRIAEPLLVAAGRGKLLQEYDRFRKPLVRVARAHGQWLRNPLEWKPDTHNTDRQFASLLRHLFAKYEVPAWMDVGFLTDDRRAASWFVHVGRGHNLRKARTLPFPLTKKQVHCAMQAPATLTPVGALRRAVALDQGCTVRIAEAWIGSRVGRNLFDPSTEEFWSSVSRWFAEVAGAMFDPSQVGPVVDYLHHIRFEPAAQELRGGRWIPSAPAQPNLTMRGRTVPALLGQVERWHGDLNHRRIKLRWNRCPTPEACWTEGRSTAATRLTVIERLSTDALVAEGRALNHCVASYDRSCHAGRTAIFSLSTQAVHEATPNRRLTIEVDRTRREVVQVRGRLNRFASPEEARWLGTWLSGTNLKLGHWVEQEFNRRQ